MLYLCTAENKTSKHNNIENITSKD